MVFSSQRNFEKIVMKTIKPNPLYQVLGHNTKTLLVLKEQSKEKYIWSGFLYSSMYLVSSLHSFGLNVERRVDDLTLRAFAAKHDIWLCNQIPNPITAIDSYEFSD